MFFPSPMIFLQLLDMLVDMADVNIKPFLERISLAIFRMDHPRRFN